MKKQRFWIILAITIGGTTGVATNNIPAGICIGPGSALLIAVVTNLETDNKQRN